MQAATLESDLGLSALARGKIDLPKAKTSGLSSSAKSKFFPKKDDDFFD